MKIFKPIIIIPISILLLIFIWVNPIKIPIFTKAEKPVTVIVDTIRYSVDSKSITLDSVITPPIKIIYIKENNSKAELLSFTKEIISLVIIIINFVLLYIKKK